MLESDPLFLIVVAVVALAFAVHRGYRFLTKKEVLNPTYERLLTIETSNATRVAEQVEGIKEADPTFDPDEFLEAAKRAFTKIRNTYSTRDFDSIHRYVSDAMLRRFTAKAAVDEFSNKRFVGAFRIISHIIFMVDQDEDHDTIHVHFRLAERGDYVPASLSAEQARLEAKRDNPEKTVSEYWSFVRRRGATTKVSLTEGKCPNCGAVVEKVATTTCEFCDAVLNSGTYDWVLSKINRDRSIDRSGDDRPEGFGDLKAADPALNRRVLEDKASLVFWKWVEAQVLGEPSRFARFCLPEAYEKAREWEGRSAKTLARVAIISVDLARVDMGKAVERAWFRVRWKRWSLTGGWALRSNFMSLEREAGQKTNRGRGMATERCHGCAAVQTARDTLRCDYCGTLFSEDWAFAAFAGPKEFAESAAAASEGG